MIDSTFVRPCPICAREVQAKAWFFRCRNCGFQFSSLIPRLGDDRFKDCFDEGQRILALKELRRVNFDKVLDSIGRHSAGGTILDVGSGHGWFLEQAQARGLRPVGIEPDAAIVDGSAVRPRIGYFPDAIDPGERFDIIAFNDSLEHLPDVNAALAACRHHLAEGGLLSINIPSANGFFYRTARALADLGLEWPFERMWQKNFASPHISYFNPDTLRRLASQHGFHEIDRQRLGTLNLSGLSARLRYDRSASVFGGVLTWAGTVAAMPMIGLLPPDITHHLFRRR